MSTNRSRLETITPDPDTAQPEAVAESKHAPTLFEAAYRKLRRDIIEGRLQPGERLRVEHLKDRYAVSAGTLREALALLVSDRLVVARGHRGFSVTPMSLGDLEDLTRTRMLLECESLRVSIGRGTDEWEAALVSAFHRLSRAEERLQGNPAAAFDEWESRNRQFHEALVGACDSAWLRRLRTLLYHQTERYRRLSALKGPPPISVHAEHREIFEAAIARDVPRATRALGSHIERALTVIRSAGLLT